MCHVPNSTISQTLLVFKGRTLIALIASPHSGRGGQEEFQTICPKLKDLLGREKYKKINCDLTFSFYFGLRMWVSL